MVERYDQHWFHYRRPELETYQHVGVADELSTLDVLSVSLDFALRYLRGITAGLGDLVGRLLAVMIHSQPKLNMTPRFRLSSRP